MTRANSIGLLRLLLAGGVLWGHSWYVAGRSDDDPVTTWILHGADSLATFGVHGFFALSGYLVMQSENRLSSTRRFLWHRLLRIYPGLWACLIFTGLGLPALFHVLSDSSIDWRSAFSYAAKNAILIRQQLGIAGFCENVPMSGDLNGSLWTLPYELGCYIGLAFLGWLGLAGARTRIPWTIAAAILLVYAHDVLRAEHALFFKTHGRVLAVWFVLGAIAARIPTDQLQRLLRWPVILGCTVVYLAACRLGGVAFLGPLTTTVIVLGLAHRLPVYNFEDTVGGDYSYGVYIYAYPMQQALASVGVLQYGMAVYIAAVSACTLALAIASWHLVEKRALALKSLAARTPVSRLAPVCSAAQP